MPTIMRMYTIEVDGGGRGACVGYYVFWHPHHLGRDRILVTENPDEACHFKSIGDALEQWKKVHPHVPSRPDGKPNRPLTAWSAEMIEHERGQPLAPAFGSTLSQHG